MTKREPDRKTYRKGTHRAVPPEATFARIKAFLPVFGITRIADLTGLDRVGLPVAQCVRPNARALAVSQGKGLDLISAKVSAAMESIEAYHAETMESQLFYGAFEDLRYRQKMAEVDRMAQDTAGFDPRGTACVISSLDGHGASSQPGPDCGAPDPRVWPEQPARVRGCFALVPLRTLYRQCPQ